MKYLAISLFVLLLAACGTPHPQGVVFRTADPALSFLVLIPQPEVVPAEEVGEVVPDPLPTPPCEVVKGNISRDGRKIYHIEGMANFNQVKIDEAKGERFFCSTEEAEAAGWIRAGN